MHTDGRFDRDTSARGHGRRIPRPKGAPTPCHSCPKIPPGAPAKTRRHAEEPTPRTRRALEHYLECAAVWRFPADPAGIVQRNARLIREVLDAAEKARHDTLLALLTANLRGK